MTDIERPVFLKEIQNKERRWTFQLAKSQFVTGRVIDFLWTSESIPITLMVQLDNEEIIEIPWVAIQTIKLGKG